MAQERVGAWQQGYNLCVFNIKKISTYLDHCPPTPGQGFEAAAAVPQRRWHIRRGLHRGTSQGIGAILEQSGRVKFKKNKKYTQRNKSSFSHPLAQNEKSLHIFLQMNELDKWDHFHIKGMQQYKNLLGITFRAAFVPFEDLIEENVRSRLFGDGALVARSIQNFP
jgi:hypothetical protein